MMACSVLLKDGIKVMFKRTNMKTQTYKWFFKTHLTCDQIKLLGTSFNATTIPINSYRKTFINSYSSDTKQGTLVAKMTLIKVINFKTSQNIILII